MNSRNRFGQQLLWSLLSVSFIGLAFANAGDLEWSGLYRIEGNALNGPELDSSINKNKNYATQTLILRPKIVAADGLYINAQFGIFNSNSAAQPEIGNQLGAYFGDGLGTTPSTNSGNSNALSENQKSETFAVQSFYLTYVQEYGSLVVGRAPVHFGLGISHNAGRELYDHYADTRDLVGYKVSMGNFYFFPMYAKVSEGSLSGYDDVSEINLQLQYENPDSDATMGVFYQNRNSGSAGNDTPADAIYNADASKQAGGFGSKNFNIFFKKETDNYSAGFEVAQQGGDLGVRDINDRKIEMSGFAVALEYEYHPKDSNKIFGIKAGMATGDNLNTTDEYEGFIFDRNYDVAMFLFNHSLGQADILHTRAIGRDTGTPADHNDTSVRGRPDVEGISNVTYISPYVKYKWSDRWSMVGSITTGILDDAAIRVGNPLSGPTTKIKSNLGYEFDLSLVFNVSEKIEWTNQIGYFEPGDAWEGGSNNFGTTSLYGFVTKAAVSF